VTYWYRDAAARRFIALGYLPWLAALSVAWEIAQLPLYTLWREASSAYIAYALAHCAVGDLVIGATALAVALSVLREARLERWHWWRVGALATVLGVSYTVFSEWRNVALLKSWAYAEAMPRLAVGGFELGLAPVAQWLLIPPLALALARLRISKEAAS
jgi:hypothetical protein